MFPIQYSKHTLLTLIYYNRFNLRNALLGRDLPATPSQQPAHRRLPRVRRVCHAQGSRPEGESCMYVDVCTNTEKNVCMYVCMYECIEEHVQGIYVDNYKCMYAC